MKKIYITVGLFVFVFWGCHDILDIEPNDRITGIWDNEALVESYINRLYNSLEYGFAFDMWGCMTDEMHAVHNAGTWEVQRGWLTADNVETTSRGEVSPTFNKWGAAYKNIRNINEALQQIETSEFGDKLKLRMKGELKFIRAYLYAGLLWRYGDVPLITGIFELNDDYTNISRESYDKVCDFIVTELDEAIALLPPQSESEKGRATPHAAMALKSRVLLYAASPLNNSDNDLNKWGKAADAAEALIDVGYTLYDDYQNLFLEETNEIIFARYFTKSQNHNINGWSGTNSLAGGGGNAPTQNIVMDYEIMNGELPYSLDDNLNRIVNPASGYDPDNPYTNRDPRFYASILYDGCMFQGHEMEKFTGGIDSPQSDVLGWNASMTGYNLKKFIDENKSVNLRTDDKSTNPWIYFRYGEILLNYAEAKFELGEEDIAKEYVNKVRYRGGMPPIEASGEALREKIRHERRIELAFEGHRFFDVRRWKILDKVFEKDLLGMEITKSSDGTKSYKIFKLDERDFHDKLYRLPIPQSEIDRSEDALTQNAGY